MDAWAPGFASEPSLAGRMSLDPQHPSRRARFKSRGAVTAWKSPQLVVVDVKAGSALEGRRKAGSAFEGRGGVGWGEGSAVKPDERESAAVASL